MVYCFLKWPITSSQEHSTAITFTLPLPEPGWEIYFSSNTRFFDKLLHKRLATFFLSFSFSERLCHVVIFVKFHFQQPPLRVLLRYTFLWYKKIRIKNINYYDKFQGIIKRIIFKRSITFQTPTFKFFMLNYASFKLGVYLFYISKQ